jgi:hypothetical protein
VKSVQGLIPRSPDDVLDPVATAGGQGDLTMVLAATAASVSGRVRSDGSRRDNMVILFSTEERRWFNRSPYIRTSESGANTRFTLAGIPPGEYFITAVDLDGRQRGGEWWTEREALLALALTARRITLSEGQSGKVDLPIVTAHR